MASKHNKKNTVNKKRPIGEEDIPVSDGQKFLDNWLLGGATDAEVADYHAFIKLFPEFTIK